MTKKQSAKRFCSCTILHKLFSHNSTKFQNFNCDKTENKRNSLTVLLDDYAKDGGPEVV